MIGKFLSHSDLYLYFHFFFYFSLASVSCPLSLLNYSTAELGNYKIKGMFY